MRGVIQFVKWWPVVTTLFILVGMATILCGVNLYSFIAPIFGCSLFTSVCWWYFSKAFKFCFWHRLFILNLIVISLIVLFDKNVHQIGFIVYVRGLILLSCTTILVSSVLYFRYGCFKTNPKGASKRTDQSTHCYG